MNDAEFVYPLAAGSGRRRRMLVMQSALALHESPQSATAQRTRRKRRRADAAPSDSSTPTPSTAHEQSTTASDDVVFAMSEQPAVTVAAIDRFHELLREKSPLTWVFTGDSLGFEAAQAQRSWIEHIEDYLRQKLGRRQDMFVDSTRDGTTVDSLRRAADWRILKAQPDIVFIAAGRADLRHELADREAFRDGLEQLVGQLQDEDCLVVLCVPPPLGTASSGLKNEQACAGLIEQVATGLDCLLVNQFPRWGQLLTDPKLRAEVVDESGSRPSRKGHVQLARLVLRDLRIGQPATASAQTAERTSPKPR